MLNLDMDVRTPADTDWDAARAAWNLALDQRPEAVAFPASAGEVAQVVRSAREQGLRVAAQATGHGAAPLAPLAGTILVKTGRMRGASVDPERRTARVEAGAQWQDVIPLAAEHGLAALAGTAPDVGVVGYTLGGGTGWLARRHGLAANSVTAIELVLADGSHVRADAGSEADVFWALRGGGGAFGVVTALEFALYPAASLYAGTMFWPWERAGEVLHAWREWTDTVPDELTSLGRIVQLPPLPTVPEPLRGRSFVVVEAAFLGDEAAGAEVVAPLRSLRPEIDMVRPMAPTELHTLHNDPPVPVPGRGDGMLLGGLDAETVDAFVSVTGQGSGSPFVGAEIRHFGGALAVAPDGAGAQPTIPAPFGTFCVGIAATPEMREAVGAHLTTTGEALAPWRSDRTFLNLADSPQDPSVLFGAETAARLLEIKARVDPDGLILANHSLMPRD
jgi:hypothetical protein